MWHSGDDSKHQGTSLGSSSVQIDPTVPKEEERTEAKEEAGNCRSMCPRNCGGKTECKNERKKKKKNREKTITTYVYTKLERPSVKKKN